MPDLAPIHGIAFVAVMAAALVTDVRERRIPNRLTGPALVLALLLAAFRSGGFPTDALLGAGAGLAVTLPLFALGGLGGGDAKLIAVVGAFLGPALLVDALAATAVVGGVMALVVSWRKGVLLPVFLRTKDLAAYLITFGRFGERRSTLESRPDLTVPYGVAIAVGSVAVWFHPLLLVGGAG